MVVKFNHLLPAMPELGMGLPNTYNQFGFVLTLFHHCRLRFFGFTGHRALFSPRSQSIPADLLRPPHHQTQIGFVFQLDFAISHPNCKPFID